MCKVRKNSSEEIVKVLVDRICIIDMVCLENAFIFDSHSPFELPIFQTMQMFSAHCELDFTNFEAAITNTKNYI
jgi:hypothetical protein